MTEAQQAEYKALEDAAQLLAIAFGACADGSTIAGNFVLDARSYIQKQADRIASSVMEAR